uniref:Uncharacterized protein n=1 Tax=Megaselia scalaris TaxID=36166 RepID=T1GTS8_MEGSC
MVKVKQHLLTSEVKDNLVAVSFSPQLAPGKEIEHLLEEYFQNIALNSKGKNLMGKRARFQLFFPLLNC